MADGAYEHISYSSLRESLLYSLRLSNLNICLRKLCPQSYRLKGRRGRRRTGTA